MDLPEDMIEKMCAENPNIKRAEQGVIIEHEDGWMHIFGMHNPKDLEVVGQKGSWYLPFCSRDEILRVLNPQSIDDALLILRAEAMVDSPRLARVFNKRRKGKKNWSLTRHYDSFKPNDRYLSFLSKGNQNRLKKIPAGLAYLEQANAMCVRTEWGNIIAVSEPLQHYLYFMNLFYFGEYLGIPDQDRSQALMIALRIMGGFESHDFDLDPRGILDWETEMFLKARVSGQYDFILGHEYAHHILGHLRKSSTTSIRLNKHAPKLYECYKYAHKKEHDADHHAIKFITGNHEYKHSITDEGFQVLLYFHMSKLVEDYISPQIHQGTHPTPLSRIKKLRQKINKKYGRPMNELEETIDYCEQVVKIFINSWLRYNIDDFEKYGSIYLPSYKKQIMIDRIDF